MSESLDPHIGVLRGFNRTYTQRIGVLQDSFLGMGRALGPSRLLFEVARHVDAVTLDQTIADVAQRLVAHGVTQVPVIDGAVIKVSVSPGAEGSAFQVLRSSDPASVIPSASTSVSCAP